MVTCENCGAFVSTAYVRVFGTNDGLVYGCPDCHSLNDLRDGGTRPSDP